MRPIQIVLATLAKLLIITPLVLILNVCPVLGATYYISSTGNDNNTGTSQAAAWVTVSKVNDMSFAPGDTVQFEGGKTFKGPLQFSSNDKGTAASRLVITSYGAGRATIDGGSLHAIDCNGTDYLTIQNINVKGLGIKTGQQFGGIGVKVDGSSFLTIDNVEASGFRWAGVEINNCPDARITNVYAHDNGYAGIRGKRNMQRLYIGYCRANNNPGDRDLNNISGSGIEVYNASDATIEYCEAGYNGGDQGGRRGNGPVGIWIAHSNTTTIQYCIAHHNTNPTGDGGGLDLDSESHHNIVQYNYCYDNKNYGIQLWQWGSKSQWLEKNIIRYNIFDNVKKNLARSIWIGHNDDSATGVRDNDFYNNLVINENPTIGLQGKKVDNLRFRNNIFVTANSTGFIVNAAEDMNFVFQGNCYWSRDGKFNIYRKYPSLEEWANATGQEKVNGKIVGLFADPQITYWDVNEPRLTDPTKLPQMKAFRLLENSPCIDKGLDLKTLFQIDPGKRDFFGHTIPAGLTFDIGACEYLVK
jgi:hypothetical protein